MTLIPQPIPETKPISPSLKTDIEQTLEVLINSDPLIPCYKVNHPNVIEYTAFSQLPQQTQDNITQGLKSLAEGNRIILKIIDVIAIEELPT